MKISDRHENSPEAASPQDSFSPDPLVNGSPDQNASSSTAASWEADVKQTLQLGEQLVGIVGGVIDLARTEALLAVRTLPKVMMLWLLMMPIMLLTWCAFSALMAWVVFAASGQIGWGMLTFFLQQVVLLFVCRWLFVKYRTRMTFPYTRGQIDNLVRSTQHEFNR
jgi:uncharacterized membrane protein YqjE